MNYKNQILSVIRDKINYLGWISYIQKTLDSNYDPIARPRYMEVLYNIKAYRYVSRSSWNQQKALSDLTHLGFIKSTSRSNNHCYDLTNIGKRYIRFTFPNHQYHKVINKNWSNENEEHPRKSRKQMLIDFLIVVAIGALSEGTYEFFQKVLHVSQSAMNSLTNPYSIIMMILTITFIFATALFFSAHDPIEAMMMHDDNKEQDIKAHSSYRHQTFVDDIQEGKGQATKKSLAKFMILYHSYKKDYLSRNQIVQIRNILDNHMFSFNYYI